MTSFQYPATLLSLTQAKRDHLPVPVPSLEAAEHKVPLRRVSELLDRRWVALEEPAALLLEDLLGETLSDHACVSPLGPSLERTS